MIRKSVLFLFVMFDISMLGFAQQGNRMTIDEYVQNLTEELELTQTQADSVKMILEDQRAEITKLQETYSGNRRIMRSKMTEIIYLTDRKIELLLNDAQKETYKNYVKERRSKQPMMSR